MNHGRGSEERRLEPSRFTQCEVDVTVTHRLKQTHSTRLRINLVDPLLMFFDGPGHARQRRPGHGSEEGFAIPEMPVGRPGCDPGPTGCLAQNHALGARISGELEPGIDERRSKFAMVICAISGSGGCL